MNSFMQRAVDLAVQNVQEGGRPFGAVLVKDGEIVHEGVNELHEKHDVSGHAEMLIIRRAQEEFQTDDLSEFSVYASGHPCPMCLAAMYFAGINDVYYCQGLEHATKYGVSGKLNLYEEMGKTNEDRMLTMNHMQLPQGQTDPMELWAQQKDLTK